jgi:hypothetical protein
MKSEKIKKWLKKHHYTQVMISEQLGLSVALVNRTIWGREKNLKVCVWLLQHGCSENYITFPTRNRPSIKEAA